MKCRDNAITKVKRQDENASDENLLRFFQKWIENESN